jgi:predicted nucleic acid-binding protein
VEGLTFDSGALIALERRKVRMARVWRLALLRGLRVSVPSPVIAEWWRARSDLSEAIVGAVVVEPVSLAIARAAGEALARLGRSRASAIDAIVVASAAARGDIVYTADVDDLCAVRDAAFPAVRILAV